MIVESAELTTLDQWLLIFSIFILVFIFALLIDVSLDIIERKNGDARISVWLRRWLDAKRAQNRKA